MSEWVYKARIVGAGHLEYHAGSGELVAGVDIWSLVAPLDLARCAVAHAALTGGEIVPGNCENAYLQADLLGQGTYVVLPESFGGDGRPRKLLRPLYGLKRAGKCWYFRLKEVLEKNGWVATEENGAIFKKYIDGSESLCVAYVDDLLLVLPPERREEILEPLA